MKRFVCFFIFVAVIGVSLSYAAQKILARVNGEPITEEDIQDALEVFPPQLRAIVETHPELKKKLLEDLISQKLLVQQMKKEGVKEDAEIKRKVEKYREALLLQKFIKGKFANIKVTDKEAKAYYEAHKDEFTVPERVKVRHILVKDKKEAEKIRKELLKGANFAELAKKYSIDKASAVKGGELGVLKRSDVIKEFGDAVFSLKKGQISEPIKTRFGYHIVQVEEKYPREVKPFSEVKSEIKTRLLEKKKEEAFKKYVEQLKAKAKVEVYMK